MARGARSVTVRAHGLSQAGCRVRAVDVVVMVDVSFVVGRSSSCVFGRRGSASRKGREMLELAVIDEKGARLCTHFLTPVTHVLCHNNYFLCSAIFR